MTETNDIVNKLASEVDDLKLDEPPEETNWNHLPLEMKEIVVREMDYITRLRFEQCSKESKRLSKSMPYYIDKVVAENIDYEEYCLSKYGYYDEYLNDSFDEDDFIRIYINGRLIDKPYLADKFNNNFLSSNIRIKHFSPQQYFPRDLEDFSLSIHAEKIQLACVTDEDCEKWLNILAPGVKSVIIMCRDRRVVSIADHPIVINAKNVQMEEFHISADQLVKFEARQLKLEHVDTSTEGVIRLIKKWVEKDYPVGSELFVSGLNDNDLKNPMEACLRNTGLQYLKRTRTYDNKTEITIPMKSGKYIALSSPAWSDSFKSITAKVCGAPAEPPDESSRNWNDLSMKIKGMIVEKMDVITRTRLKVCSKSAQNLVDSTPLHLSNMTVHWGPRFGHSCSIDGLLALRVKNNHFDICNIVNCFFDIKRRFTYDTEEEAKDRLKDIINSFVVNKNVTVDHACFERFLPHFNGVTIMNAKKLEMINVEISDDQLLLFNSTQMEIYNKTSAAHSDKLLKKWIDEDYPIVSKFLLRFEHKDEQDWKVPRFERFLLRKRVTKVPMKSGKFIELTRSREYRDWTVTAEICKVPVETPNVSPNWKDLPDKVKGMIVEKMDLFTRTRLKLCSKSDKQLVESTPHHLRRMNYSHRDDHCFEIDGILAIQVCKTDLLICNEYHRIKCDSNEEARDRLKMIVNSFVQSGNLTVDSVGFDGVSEDFGGEMIMNAKELAFNKVKITDDQMLHFKSRDFSISHGGITKNGVNRLLKKMIEENYPIRSSFDIYDIPSVESINDVCDGLEVMDSEGRNYIKLGSDKIIGLIFRHDVEYFSGKKYKKVTGTVCESAVLESYKF